MTMVHGAAAGMRSAQELIAGAREVVVPRYQAAVEDVPSEVRRLIGYHAGWWDLEGRPTRPNGRFLPSVMALLCAQSGAGRLEEGPEGAKRGAVALSMMLDAVLLHDDVTDRDTGRRGRPAAWTQFGSGPALYAGCVLYCTAVAELAGSPLLAEYNRAVRLMNEGQFMDTAAEERRDVTLDDYLDGARMRTGEALGTACVMGASAIGEPEERLALYRTVGVNLGVCYQIRNDMIGIWSHEAEASGKAGRTDLSGRKRSGPVVAALTSGTDAGARLRDLYLRPEAFTSEETALAVRLIEEAGGRDWAQTQLRRRAEEVDVALTRLRPAAEDSGDLRTVVSAVASPFTSSAWPGHPTEHAVDPADDLR
ncbi:polyprenyl synthetase family protein [Streptomyces sp. NPDC004667]|uniref:polyprenyl synthetase family protein n=1 Tax=Streptomyces sp. NPDC004667 TaxID=3154285 RepID=UPI0033B11E31